VTAFTVGHSVTLALAVTNLLVLPSRLVEFLIPVTIVLTGIENLVLRERAALGRAARHRPIFAGVFGLVHGAGFADYLRSLFVDRIAVPLVGFNLGIEMGQLVVLAAAGVVFWLADRALNQIATRLTGRAAFHWRLVGVSLAVTIVAGHWAWLRWPG
jgi:hypothetical protein